MATEVDRLVDDLFRRCAGRLVARLTRALGPRHLPLAEECVQDALLRALQHWPHRGIPDQPESWLMRVARNRAVDRLRRSDRWETELPDGDPEALAARIAHVVLDEAGAPGGGESGAFGDDELAMVFACCDPSLGLDAAVALTLNTVGGLSAREIATAFLVPEATVAQRIVRAKKALRRLPELRVPEAAELPERLDAVLAALYLLFNEGYLASEGDLLVRRELCHEAIRLAELVALHPRTASPNADALLALMLLQASRLAARTDETGELQILAEQDRARWDTALRDRGLRHLERAARGERLGRYHIEAGIASCHAVAPSFDATDWATIVRWYELLARVAPSPVVTLNAAVALAMRDGPDAGLALLDEAGDPPGLAREPLLESVRGWLFARADRPAPAAAAYLEAAARSRSAPVRRYLRARAAELDAP